jgi:hypothetical protein
LQGVLQQGQYYLSNIGFRKTIDGTEKRIIVTYSYNTNGSINNIDLVGELPACY